MIRPLFFILFRRSVSVKSGLVSDHACYVQSLMSDFFSVVSRLLDPKVAFPKSKRMTTSKAFT